MSDLSRHRPYLVWGLVLLVIAIGLTLAVTPTETWVALDQRRSTERTTADGVAAWARALDTLGVPVAARYTSLVADPPRGGGLVILEPLVTPTAQEAHLVLEWVRDGGTLVYSPMFEELLMDSLGLGLEYLTFGFTKEGLPDESLVPHRWTGDRTDGPGAASVMIWADSLRATTWEPLSYAAGEDQPTLAWLPEGAGGVLVLADAEALANQSLSASTTAAVVARALVDRLGPSDTLFFSEYHQGLGGTRGILREGYALTARTPWGRALIHLGVVSVLLALLAGRRFGRPLPEPPAGRRSTLEHVRGLARIYAAAGSQGAVARHLIRGTARRLGALHPSGPDPEERILTEWQARPELTDSAAAALTAYRSDPPDLVALERALDRITFHHATAAPER